MAVCVTEIDSVVRVFQSRRRGENSITDSSPWYAQLQIPGGAIRVLLAPGLEKVVREGYRGAGKFMINFSPVTYTNSWRQSVTDCLGTLGELLAYREEGPVRDAMDSFYSASVPASADEPSVKSKRFQN